MENTGGNTGDDEDEMWHHCTLVDALVDEVSAVGQTRRTSMEKHGERSERVCDWRCLGRSRVQERAAGYAK